MIENTFRKMKIEIKGNGPNKKIKNINLHHFHAQDVFL